MMLDALRIFEAVEPFFGDQPESNLRIDEPRDVPVEDAVAGAHVAEKPSTWTALRETAGVPGTWWEHHWS